MGGFSSQSWRRLPTTFRAAAKSPSLTAAEDRRGMARTDKNNVTRYWWDRHIPGLSLMSADFTSHDYATHTHDAFVIAISAPRGAKIKSRGTPEPVHPPRLFVSDPDDPP